MVGGSGGGATFHRDVVQGADEAKKNFGLYFSTRSIPKSLCDVFVSRFSFYFNSKGEPKKVKQKVDLGAQASILKSCSLNLERDKVTLCFAGKGADPSKGSHCPIHCPRAE